MALRKSRFWPGVLRPRLALASAFVHDFAKSYTERASLSLRTCRDTEQLDRDQEYRRVVLILPVISHEIFPPCCRKYHATLEYCRGK